MADNKVKGSHPARGRYKSEARSVTNKKRRAAKYLKCLEKKVLQLITRSKSVVRIQKEIDYVKGTTPRPTFLTGTPARMRGMKSQVWDPS